MDLSFCKQPASKKKPPISLGGIDTHIGGLATVMKDFKTLLALLRGRSIDAETVIGIKKRAKLVKNTGARQDRMQKSEEMHALRISMSVASGGLAIPYKVRAIRHRKGHFHWSREVVKLSVLTFRIR